MTIGASIFCLALGAILTFAVETDSTEGINVNNVGIILMIAGAVGLVVYLLVWGPRTRRVAPAPYVEERRVAPPVVVREVVAEERVVTTPVASSRPVVERRVVE